MNQYRLRMDKIVKNIEWQIVEKSPVANQSGGKSDRNESLEQAQKMKVLQDRIRILELELQRAREESFKLGYEEGKENTLKEANRRIQKAQQQMEAMKKSYLEVFKRIELPLLEVAKKMAVQILQQELQDREDRDEIFLKRLRSMLSEIAQEKEVIIEVNEEQLSLLNSGDIHSRLDLPREMEITFKAGKQLARGEALIESENYYVDGRYEVQAEELKQKLYRGE